MSYNTDNLFTVANQKTATPIEVLGTNKSVKISKITLENYRSIKYLVIDTNDKNVVFSGVNGVGKTSIIEAVFLLLSGRLFDGRAKLVDQDIKPVGSPNDTKTSITVQFNTGFEFSGTFFGKYSSDGLLTETVSIYTVNGAVEKSVRLAYATLHEHLGIKKVNDRFSTDPLLKKLDFIRLFYDLWYLKQLDYKLLRALVIDVVGDTSYEEIINQNTEQYGMILTEFNKSNKDLDALKERLRGEKFGTKISPSGLEMRINVLQEQIRTYEQQAEVVIDNDEIKRAKDKIAFIDAEINTLKLDLQKSAKDLTSQLRAEITTKELAVANEKARIREAWEQSVNKVNDENELASKQLQTLKAKLVELENAKKKLDLKLSNENYELKDLNVKLANKQYHFDDAVNSYKTENRQITAPVSKEVFNLYDAVEFADRKDELEGKIKALKDGYHAIKDDIMEQEKVVGVVLGEVKALEKSIDELKKSIEDEQKNITLKKVPEFTTTESPLIVELNAEIDTIKQQIKEIESGNEEHEQRIKDKITELTASKEPLKAVVDKEVERNLNIKYAKETREKLHETTKRLEMVNTYLELIKMLEKDKYTRLDANIGAVFGENIKFKMFDYNQDGSIDTRVCDLLVKDGNGTFVNIKNINTGNYPISALDFITRIKKHYGVEKSFIFIDEFGQIVGENITSVLGFGEQVLATKPSDKPKITIELL